MSFEKPVTEGVATPSERRANYDQASAHGAGARNVAWCPNRAAVATGWPLARSSHRSRVNVMVNWFIHLGILPKVAVALSAGSMVFSIWAVFRHTRLGGTLTLKSFQHLGI